MSEPQAFKPTEAQRRLYDNPRPRRFVLPRHSGRATFQRKFARAIRKAREGQGEADE